MTSLVVRRDNILVRWLGFHGCLLSWVLAFVGVFYFSLSMSLSLAKKKGCKEFAQVILLWQLQQVRGRRRRRGRGTSWSFGSNTAICVAYQEWVRREDRERAREREAPLTHWDWGTNRPQPQSPEPSENLENPHSKHHGTSNNSSVLTIPAHQAFSAWWNLQACAKHSWLTTRAFQPRERESNIDQMVLLFWRALRPRERGIIKCLSSSSVLPSPNPSLGGCMCFAGFCKRVLGAWLQSWGILLELLQAALAVFTEQITTGTTTTTPRVQKRRARGNTVG